jgi:hypothetical protein
MGLARFRVAARATERIRHLVISRFRLTRIGVGRGLSKVTLHSSRQLRIASGFALVIGASGAFVVDYFGDRLRGPRFWRGARSGGIDEGVLSE